MYMNWLSMAPTFSGDPVSRTGWPTRSQTCKGHSSSLNLWRMLGYISGWHLYSCHTVLLVLTGSICIQLLLVAYVTDPWLVDTIGTTVMFSFVQW